MTTNTQQDPKPDGAAFDDFFDSIGKKAENLTSNGQNGESAPATNGAKSTNKPEDDGEPKIVDEIESLCMNCRENVCAPKLLQCAHS
jgi:zinc finger protein